MQEDEARAVGTEQQVVEVVLGPRQVAVRVGDRRRVGHGDDLAGLAGVQVHGVDARLFGGELVRVRVGDALVAVAGTHVVEAPEVGADGGAAVGRQRVHRGRHGAAGAGGGVGDARNVAVAGARVPDHLARRSGQPLQHAALLPAPRGGGAERPPGVAILQVDHADADLVAGPRRAMLEVDRHGQHVARGRIELQLVVVPEPVVTGAPGDGPDRHLRLRIAHSATEGRLVVVRTLLSDTWHS